MSTSAAPVRFAFAAIVALFLALRVLVSAGYMPSLEHGRLTLMPCPDGEWAAPATSTAGMGAGHGSSTGHHQQCFYAAAAAMSFAGAAGVAMLLVVTVAFAFVIACALSQLERRSRFERPFSTGPPLPA